MHEVTIESLRTRVRATRGPQFLLPARFVRASFERYQPDPAFPSQADAVDQIRRLLDRPEPGRSRVPRRRRPVDGGPRGIYLDGPPGIGKTHLLAAAYLTAAEPKLFVSFDELAASAGTLGMRRLEHLLAEQQFVCIDEVDLRDSGNIMLFSSLLRAMLRGRPRILASSNRDPQISVGSEGLANDFARELGEIAGAFSVVRLDGVDRRTADLVGTSFERRLADRRAIVRFNQRELLTFLGETHPMCDAAWLELVDVIELDRLDELPDTDLCLRVVRLIDRVYDRAVALGIGELAAPVDLVLSPLRDDRRFMTHYARCRSRMLELTGAGVAAD